MQKTLGKTFDQYPFGLISTHAKMLKPAVGVKKNEMEAAKAGARQDGIQTAPAQAPKVEFTKQQLIAYANGLGVITGDLSKALREADLNPDHWDPKLEARYKAVAEKLANHKEVVPA